MRKSKSSAASRESVASGVYVIFGQPQRNANNSRIIRMKFARNSSVNTTTTTVRTQQQKNDDDDDDNNNFISSIRCWFYYRPRPRRARVLSLLSPVEIPSLPSSVSCIFFCFFLVFCFFFFFFWFHWPGLNIEYVWPSRKSCITNQIASTIQ